MADTPLYGAVEPDWVLLVKGLVPNATFALIPVEDLIADRMGQFASGTASEMLEQARIPFRLHPDLDRNLS